MKKLPIGAKLVAGFLAMGSLRASLAVMMAAQRGFVLAAMMNDPRAEASKAQFLDTSAKVDGLLKSIDGGLLDPAQNDMVKRLQQGRAAWFGYFDSMVQSCAKQECNVVLDLMSSTVMDHFDKMDSASMALETVLAQSNSASMRSVVSGSRRFFWLVIALLLLCADRKSVV